MNLLNSKFLIGVSYLPPSKGFANFPGNQKLIDHVKYDLDVAIAGGLNGILIENESDRPYSVLASEGSVESMTIAMEELKKFCPEDFYLGVEFLINDPHASISVAKKTDSHFIRTDYFVDKMFREEYGELSVDTEDFQRHRKSIQAEKILVLADIQVKYAKMLKPKGLDESARQAELALADAVVVSSDETGTAPSLEDLKLAKSGTSIPIVIGSGLSLDNITELMSVADGALVGSSIMNKDYSFEFRKVKSLVSTLKNLEKNL